MRAIFPWEIRHQNDTYGAVTNRIARRIIVANRFGMVLVFAALPTLIGALTLALMPQYGESAAWVRVDNEHSVIPGCGTISAPFETRIQNSELLGNGSFIQLTVPGRMCKNNLDRGLRVILPRKSVSVVLTTD